MKRIYFLSLFISIIFLSCKTEQNKLPKGFVYLADVDPSIQIDLKYMTHDNFVGVPINGYHKKVCICTEEAAIALKQVQNEVNKMGWSLVVFDAYRPQKAVDHFMEWVAAIDDTLTKSKFYPNVDKKDLFKLNYIASKSSHSRGSTFDVNILDKNGNPFDMGTPFDYFGPESWPSYENLSWEQKAIRTYLQMVMKNHGFEPYKEEWWHFTLKDEPFPKSYFNFDVE